MDYCVSLFWLLCLESSCPNVCPLSRCESLLHNNYRKGVPVHPARNTRAPGTAQICLNLKIWEVDSFFFLAPFFIFHLTWSFLLPFLLRDEREATWCLLQKSETLPLRSHGERSNRHRESFSVFFCKAKKPHFLLFLSVSLQTNPML